MKISRDGCLRALAGWQFGFCLLAWTVHAAPVLTCDETALRAAIAAGGTATFDCDGSILLSSTIVIGNDVTLDATGRSVVISGGNAVRLFTVQPGVSFTLRSVGLVNGSSESGSAVLSSGGTLRLINCALSNHRASGTNGTGMFSPGGQGFGGAIATDTGVVTAVSCVFSNNQARGGKGGNNMFAGCGGAADGGAIYSRNSIVNLTNCQFIANSA